MNTIKIQDQLENILDEVCFCVNNKSYYKLPYIKLNVINDCHHNILGFITKSKEIFVSDKIKTFSTAHKHLLIIHEVSHIIEYDKYGKYNLFHGYLFRSIYSKLLTRYIVNNIYKKKLVENIVKVAFGKNRVYYPFIDQNKVLYSYVIK